MLWNHTNYESAVNVLIIKDVENLGRAYMDSIVDHNGHRYHLRNNFPRRLQHGHSQRSTKCELFMLHSYYVLEKKKNSYVLDHYRLLQRERFQLIWNSHGRNTVESALVFCCFYFPHRWMFRCSFGWPHRK